MASTNKKAQVHAHASAEKAELTPQDYVEMAEQSDEVYEAKQQVASEPEDESTIETAIDGTLQGVENAIRILAKKLGMLASRPDPRTYLEQLASTSVKSANAEFGPDESQKSEVDSLIKDPSNGKALEPKQ